MPVTKPRRRSSAAAQATFIASCGGLDLALTAILNNPNAKQVRLQLEPPAITPNAESIAQILVYAVGKEIDRLYPDRRYYVRGLELELPDNRGGTLTVDKYTVLDRLADDMPDSRVGRAVINAKEKVEGKMGRMARRASLSRAKFQLGKRNLGQEVDENPLIMHCVLIGSVKTVGVSERDVYMYLEQARDPDEKVCPDEDEDREPLISIKYEEKGSMIRQTHK